MKTAHKNIISASRRTDIPAFYGEWFVNRIDEGWCFVPNPLNCNQISFVSLKQENVTAIVFWSKNPAPFIKHIKTLEERGYLYYFQFTLNDYPKIIEPGIPDIENRVQTFIKLSQKIGKQRVVWRYDPIIISDHTPVEFHREKFQKLSSELEGYTTRLMVSFVDYYQKTINGLLHIGRSGIDFDKEFIVKKDALDLLKEFYVIAKSRGIEIFTCAEETDFSETGVTPGRCIDGDLLNRLWSLKGNFKKDKTQRQSCLCIESKDIGVNDTCLHGCPYCYSTRNITLAKRRYEQHDPLSPILWGKTRNLTEEEQSIINSKRLL